MSERCDLTDLPVDGCAHCRGISDEPATVEDVRMQITSRFSGRCANCGKPYPEGALIGHSDDAGGWVGSCCTEVER